MGKGLYQFRHDNYNRKTFHVFYDDIADLADCENSSERYDSAINYIRNAIKILAHSKGYTSCNLLFSHPYYGEQWSVLAQNGLFDLVISIQDDYAAIAALPDLYAYTQTIPHFRYSLFRGAANKFFKELSTLLPLRPYAGPWTPGILIDDWDAVLSKMKPEYAFTY